jgi:hypothetical protein
MTKKWIVLVLLLEIFIWKNGKDVLCTDELSVCQDKAKYQREVEQEMDNELQRQSKIMAEKYEKECQPCKAKNAKEA